MEEKKLDCLLVCPLFIFPDGFYSNQRALDPPLGLLALAAYVREYNFTVGLLDCNLESAATDSDIERIFIERYVNVYSEIGVIGFTTTTPTVNAAFRAAKIFKKFFPQTKIIFGGAHASYVPDESLDKPYVDAVVMGEGEDTLKEILEGRPFNEIDGLAYKENILGAITFKRNKPRGRIKTLDELPRPAYDLINIENYRPIIGNYKRLPAMMLVTSRGCPWSCNFCRRPVGKMWTYRSAQSLYDEMKYLSETFGIKDLALMDDVFTVNVKRVMDLCNLLIEKPLDIKWKCFARVDIVSQEMLKKMNEAGCWGIMFGVENFNQEILNGINKGVELEQIYNAVKWSKEANLEIRVCMIVGNVGDTVEIINNNIKLLKKLDPDYISVAILTPFPGHDIYNWALERDLITTFDWDLYYGSTPIMKLDTLTPEQITSLFRKMTFSFYFRPSFILKKVLKLRSFTELKSNAKGFWGLFGFMAEKFWKSLQGLNSSNQPRVSQPIHKAPPVVIDNAKIIELTKTATPQTAIT